MNLVDRENPIKSVDGCVIWSESRQYTDISSLVKDAYDRYARPPAIELFDLQEDPYCYINQVDNPRFGFVKQRLLEALEKWRKETNDPYLDKKYLDDMTKKHDLMAEEHNKK